MKLNTVFTIADVFVGIAGIFSSIYCGVKCAKINEKQMNELADKTSTMLLMKLAQGSDSKEEKEEEE